jgi:hypothetical protein
LCYSLKIIEIGVAIILLADLEGIHVATCFYHSTVLMIMDNLTYIL